MSRVASNYKILDKTKDKDLIEQMDKEHQEELTNIDYAIDLNTNEVKQNKHYTFLITDDINKNILSYDDALNKDLQDMYLKNMNTFNKGLDTYIDLDNFRVVIKDKIDIKDKDNLDKYTSKLDNIDALNKAIVQFNKFYDSMYLDGFNLRVKDLLNNSIKKEYIKQLASAYTQVQVSDLIRIKKDNKDIKDFINKNNLDDITSDIEKFIDDANNDLSNNTNTLSDIIYKSNLDRFKKDIDIVINNNKQYYKKVHKLYQEIDNKILFIVNQFRLKYNNLGTQLITKKSNITKQPTTIYYDFDIVKFFSNIYPNFKFKSIDDNRHQKYDYKAKLVLDIDIENPKTMEEMRVSRFLSYMQDIELHPIQYAIIDSAISIRDTNGADSLVPLVSILKNYREDNTTRLPTKKTDLDLYEDFMLFNKHCKASFYVKDRETQQIIKQPTPLVALLENDEVDEKNRVYWIGRSALNFFKERYQELEGIETPRIHTHQKSKKYLNYSKSKSVIMDNVVQFIYPRITTMINSYKNYGKYQSKINITHLYLFMVDIYKRNKYIKLNTHNIDKDDKHDIKEYVKSYLDDLKKKGLIDKYTNDKDIFKIEINKDFKL